MGLMSRSELLFSSYKSLLIILLYRITQFHLLLQKHLQSAEIRPLLYSAAGVCHAFAALVLSGHQI